MGLACHLPFAHSERPSRAPSLHTKGHHHAMGTALGGQDRPLHQVCMREADFEPDTYLGVPSSAEGVSWMKLGLAMAIMENGTECLDYFAMIDGWILAREYAQGHVASTKSR